MKLLDPLHRMLYRTRVKKERKPKELAKKPTPYNERAKKAFAHGKAHRAFRTQVELAKQLDTKQQNVNTLLNRPTDGSSFTVRFAHACGVSPLWLESGEGEMELDRASLSDPAIHVAIAWSHLPKEVGTRYGREIIPVAPNALPPTRPVARLLERWLKELRKEADMRSDLADKTPNR